MSLRKTTKVLSLFILASVLFAQGSAPTIDPGGVVSAADYTTAIAPGAIVAIYGKNLSTNIVSASSIPLPTSLDGTTVEVNGQAVPLFFVSPGQVNAQMPFGISGQADVRVRTGAGLSGAQAVTLVARAPRVFTTAMDGKGAAILCHGADWSVVSADRPALPDEGLGLFLTGLGAVEPQIAAGQPGGDGGALGPLNQLPAGAVKVTIGGLPGEIFFAGLTPTLVGLYQINFKVPLGIAAGNYAVVVTTADGVSQPLVRGAVGGPAQPGAPGNTIEFVTIPAGEFMMGCAPDDTTCDGPEKPRHKVRITKPFEMGRFEVTQGQYEAVMGNNPSSSPRTPDRPVIGLTYDDVTAFVTALNARNDGYTYRKPTEAEWEYAARAETTAAYYGPLNDIGWYTGNSGSQTKPVGQKQPNAWGLYDMIGNALEWCQDWWSQSYYASSPEADPQGPEFGSYRILRSSGAQSDITNTRTTFRWGFVPTLNGGEFGFRVVRTKNNP